MQGAVGVGTGDAVAEGVGGAASSVGRSCRVVAPGLGGNGWIRVICR